MGVELVPLSSMVDDSKFWPGSVLRLFDVGMNVEKDQDFYDYMLINVPWEGEHLVVANVTHDNSKAGAVMCAVPIAEPGVSKAVDCAALKKSLGDGPWYWVKAW